MIPQPLSPKRSAGRKLPGFTLLGNGISTLFKF
jgi:hypothetical protein